MKILDILLTRLTYCGDFEYEGREVSKVGRMRSRTAGGWDSVVRLFIYPFGEVRKWDIAHAADQC